MLQRKCSFATLWRHSIAGVRSVVEQALFVRVELNAESAAPALGDVDGVAFAAADLVQDGLAREPGAGCGVGEADVAVGDVGDEAAANVVCEFDAPGSVRRGLLGGQEAFA